MKRVLPHPVCGFTYSHNQNLDFLSKTESRSTKESSEFMGYYANCAGTVEFKRDLSIEERTAMEELLDSICFDFDFDSAKHNKSWDTLNVYAYEKYHEEELAEALEQISRIVPIEKGCVECTGDDDAHWRFLYKQEDERWHKQNGYIVYEDT